MASKLARSLVTYARTINVRPSLQPTCRAWKTTFSRPAPSPAALMQIKRWSSDTDEFNEPPAEKGYRYATSHEWVLFDNNIATVGVSNYAQGSLGDVVFVELPEVDTELEQNDQIGVLESVKAAADIYSPISGKVIEVNTALEDQPELINKDPYSKGWLIKMEASNVDQRDLLMSVDKYETRLKESV